jgi:hypothetical protein
MAGEAGAGRVLVGRGQDHRVDVRPIMSPLRNQPGTRTEIRLGVRAAAFMVEKRRSGISSVTVLLRTERDVAVKRRRPRRGAGPSMIKPRSSG